MQEFEYYTQRKERQQVDDSDGGQQIPTDPFAEHLLHSTQNADLKNVSSRSVILAPFNSTMSDIGACLSQQSSIKEMIMPRKVIKYNPKVREINRQYELNNNAELDNGVYHQEGDHNDDNGGTCGTNNDLGNDGGLPSIALQEKSLATSFGQQQLQSQLGEIMLVDEGIENISGDDSPVEESKLQNSEWRQLEREILKDNNRFSMLQKGHQMKEVHKDRDYEDLKVELIDDRGRPVQQSEKQKLDSDAVQQI